MKDILMKSIKSQFYEYKDKRRIQHYSMIVCLCTKSFNT